MSSRYRLIGHPLGHSLSPFIHKRLFALSGQTEDYTLYDIAPESLSDAVPALLGEIRGCNVTIPHKQKVLPFIDRLDGKAAVYQTVNCIAVTEDGVIGYNTDGDGFLAALKQDCGLSPEGLRVLMIGAGGAAKAIHYALRAHGAKQITVACRDPKRAEAFALWGTAVAEQDQ